MNETKRVCETCRGTGDLVVGWTKATWVNPPEPTFAEKECPVCMGTGWVRVWELEEDFDGEFPTEEEAREMLWVWKGGER
jgi:hypothetical protein